jgi:hypothetical protein
MSNTLKFVSENNNFYYPGGGLVTAELNGEIITISKNKKRNNNDRFVTEYYLRLVDKYNPSNKIDFTARTFKELVKQIEQYYNPLVPTNYYD